MRISMSVSIKIFFRSIIYLAICAVLFLLSNFFLMRFFNASNYLAEFHVTSLKLGIVGYIVFSFLSYEYTNLPRTSALQEAIEPANKLWERPSTAGDNMDINPLHCS